MDSTRQFVDKVQDTQRKAKNNKRRSGNGSQGEHLPGKQHSTNK
ncbi:DUF4023 family protein [Cohnella faecalis]|uniref:DUF4023 domain-containing protein n=1 Tax=Cohnella faecalis TaxID=2315694 RepID=A0A398CJL4_9BACL|nr:DUF4023 family protein [Cohnella faecalis]RIE01028.1 DUF4023 domain-containing protein [Cohnella faecalis]